MTQKLIDRLEQILPGIQNSNSQAEVAMVEALPEVIAALNSNAATVAALAELVRIDDHHREMRARLYAKGSPTDKAWNAARKALESSK